MLYRPLGQTSLSVSVLGFGAAPLGEEYGQIDVAEGQRAVDAAIDHGINYFDVAPYYGRTLAETRLGHYLAGKREQVVLATKVGRYDKFLPDGFDFSADRVIRSTEQSLRRLQTDVIDVMQVHDVEFGDSEVIINETLPALYRLKEQGKVRLIGVTGYPLGLLKQIASATEVDVVLSYCHYNLMDTTMNRVLAPLALERGIGLINASPLHMGVLTNDGAPNWHPAPPEVHETARQAAAYCTRHGTDISALALQFALDNEAVATTLTGMSAPWHIERNLQAVGVKPDPDLLAAVQSIIEPVADLYWPSGLPENQRDLE